MSRKLNKWLEKLPATLETRLDDAVGHGEFASFEVIPMEYALEEAYEIVTEYADESNELYENLVGDNGEEVMELAKADLEETVKYTKKWQKELEKKKEEVKGIENLDSGNTSNKSEEGVEDKMGEEQLEPKAENEETEGTVNEESEVTGEAEQNEAKPNDDEKDGNEKATNGKAKFKWLNRPKATMTAVTIKHEENITAEEACKRILAEYEGVYFNHPELMSPKRWENFIERVEADKTYKKSKTEIPEYTFTQKAIELIKEQGELTELQAITLDGIFSLLAPYEVGYSNIQVEDVAGVTDLKPEQVKGTLGHLIKKGFVYTDEMEVGDETQNLIFIDNEKYGLYNDDILAKKEGVELDKLKEEDEAMDDIEELMKEEA